VSSSPATGGVAREISEKRRACRSTGLMMNSETREGIGRDLVGATAAPAAEAQLRDGGMSKIKYEQDEATT
jgi:hypothetical protein